MPRARQRLTPRTSRRGFTLPEILIVIVMVSLLAIVAIPRFATANGKRHLESARMRIAAGLATARQAAIQKGEPVRFSIGSNYRVTVKRVATTDTTDLITPVPLDTLYKVTVTLGGGFSLPFNVDYSARGFSTNLGSAAIVRLSRQGMSSTDSVMVTTTGMVRR